MKSIKSFLGVFAHDKIPALDKRKKQSFILNYDKYGNYGTHWVAIFHDSDKKYSEVFGSYGIFPSNILQKALKKLNKPILYNSGQIQSLKSNRCGWYAMDYIKKRHRGLEPADIIFEYKPNGSLENDKILMKIIE